MNYSVNLEKGKRFEVDVFIPSRALAFEYNGEYHYKYIPLYPQVMSFLKPTWRIPFCFRKLITCH